ncbi:hypothetical protein HNP02_007900 [Mycobacterium sp. AZCC_0083]|nr:hypothetical protein [Mycobacterium sp. AZCC_0083]
MACHERPTRGKFARIPSRCFAAAGKQLMGALSSPGRDAWIDAVTDPLPVEVPHVQALGVGMKIRLRYGAW